MTTDRFSYCRTGFLLSISLTAAAAFWLTRPEVVTSHEANGRPTSAETAAPSFVMDATVPDAVADYLRDHPNPHVRIFSRRSAKNTSL